MALFKRTYTDKNGKKRQTRKWYGQFTDENGERKRVPLATNKEASRQMLADHVRRSELARAGLVNPYESHHTRLLKDHVEAFNEHLKSKGNSESHISLTISRITAIIEACGFRFISDIQVSSVSNYLAVCREEGMGCATSNHYATAAKSFGAWMVRDHRTNVNPLIHLEKINAESDIRRARRILGKDEFHRFLISTMNGETINGISGSDREMLYTLAAFTGYRASELASLTPKSIDFVCDPPVVKVEGSYSKNKKTSILPLHRDVAAKLKEWITNSPRLHARISIGSISMNGMPKTNNERLWPGRWAEQRHGAKMVKKDLRAARTEWIEESRSLQEREQREDSDFLKYKDDDSRVFDFHALRSVFISALVHSGAHLKEIQMLARHAKIETTLRHYAKLGLRDIDQAVQRLPGLPQPSRAIDVAQG